MQAAVQAQLSALQAASLSDQKAAHNETANLQLQLHLQQAEARQLQSILNSALPPAPGMELPEQVQALVEAKQKLEREHITLTQVYSLLYSSCPDGQNQLLLTFPIYHISTLPFCPCQCKKDLTEAEKRTKKAHKWEILLAKEIEVA